MFAQEAFTKFVSTHTADIFSSTAAFSRLFLSVSRETGTFAPPEMSSSKGSTEARAGISPIRSNFKTEFVRMYGSVSEEELNRAMIKTRKSKNRATKVPSTDAKKVLKNFI